MNEKNKILSVGILLLALIIVILIIAGNSQALSGTGSKSTTGKSASSTVPQSNALDGDGSTVTPTPAITPVIISSTPTPAPAPEPARNSVSYITMVPKYVEERKPIDDIRQDMPVPSYANYFTVFSLTNEEIGQYYPYVIFTLNNPPLVLDFDVMLMNITDVKYYEYKIKSNKYEVSKTNIRPFEEAYFHVTVRDYDGGAVVAEEGVGGVYGMQTHKQVLIHKGGTYIFDFTGRAATVTLSMKVKREGNIR